MLGCRQRIDVIGSPASNETLNGRTVSQGLPCTCQQLIFPLYPYTKDAVTAEFSGIPRSGYYFTTVLGELERLSWIPPLFYSLDILIHVGVNAPTL